MVISIESGTVCEEEVRARFPGDGGLDPPDGLRDGAELECSDAGGGEEWGEHHVVPWGHADDVVQAGVDSLHEPAPGPPGPHHHHSGLLVGLRRAQPGVPARIRLRCKESSERMG